MKELAQFIGIVSVAAIAVGGALNWFAVWRQNNTISPQILRDLEFAEKALRDARKLIEQLTKKENEDDSNT
jgi:hypothetical protein